MWISGFTAVRKQHWRGEGVSQAFGFAEGMSPKLC